MNLISIVVLDTLMSCLEVYFVIISIKNLTSSIGAVKLLKNTNQNDDTQK